MKATQDILGNPLISWFIRGNCGVELLNRRFLPCRLQRRPETRQAGNDIMPLFRLFSGIYPIPDRPALHEDDRMVTIPSRQCGRQTIDIFCGQCCKYK
ncbi:MAG: hypothetical protein NT140_13200 [Deltaproteobacteria bacterium]|nr:hypothetical protein [Deltaproteobacteria bacterium]